MNSSAYNDPRWNAENFARQPIDDVRRAIKFLEKRDITEYNVQSLSTAKLGAVVVGALGGKKAKASVEDFLPFDTRRIKKDSGITDATMDVFKKLMRTRRLDGRLIALLVDELKTASLRNSE